MRAHTWVSGSLLVLFLLCGCTETVVRHTPLPLPGAEIKTLPVDSANDHIHELEAKLRVFETRMELLYRVTAARLAYLEVLSEYQSIGLGILAKGEVADPNEEARMFSELSAHGQHTREQLQVTRKELKESLRDLPPGSAIAVGIDGWLQRFDALATTSPPVPKPGVGRAR